VGLADDQILIAPIPYQSVTAISTWGYAEATLTVPRSSRPSSDLERLLKAPLDGAFHEYDGNTDAGDAKLPTCSRFDTALTLTIFCRHSYVVEERNYSRVRNDVRIGTEGHPLVGRVADWQRSRPYLSLAPPTNLVDAAQEIGRILVDAERTGLSQLIRPVAAT
jgi:hypothetical protein